MMVINNESFEKVICSKCLIDSTYLATISDHLNVSYFKDKNLAKLFAIAKAFYNKRDKLPTLQEVSVYITDNDLKRTFKEVLETIKEITHSPIDDQELYDNTEKFLKEKAIYNTMLEIANDIAAGKTETADALTKIEKAYNISLVPDIGLDLYKDIDLLIKDLNRDQRYIPSKWPWVDELLEGGFQENGRALYVFAGETNIGKSIVLGNLAVNIAEQNKNVLLVTLEMPEMLYAKRMCTNISKIPMRDLKANTQALKSAINDQTSSGKIIIKEFPPSTITPNQLKAFIKKIFDQGIKLDAIVLDYLNLLHSPIGTNSYERVKHVTEQVRAMSYIFNCPIISATQLNRSGFNQDNPEMSTISESAGLAMTADAIFSIYQNEEDREIGIIRFGSMKNRFGPRGPTQAMRIDYGTLTITQADDIDSYEEESISALAVFSS